MTRRQAIGLAVGAAVLLPSRVMRDGPTLCAFRRITGRPCPTCGMSRSWNALARGRVDDSFRFHPLGPAALAVAVAAAIVPADQLNHPALRSPKVVVPITAAWMAVWLVRFVRAPRATACS